MRIDCHCHTARYSPCSHMEPEELCRLALARGLDALVLTEHHQFWPEDELAELRAAYPGLALYNGMEFTVSEGFDVLCVSGSFREDTGWRVDLADFLEGLGAARADTFLCVAHPFRYDRTVDAGLQEVLAAVDGIEMNSVNILRAGHERGGAGYISRHAAHYEAARGNYGLVALYNSDCHYPVSVGSVFNEFPGVEPPLDESGLAALLRGGGALERQDAAQVGRALAMLPVYPF